jgi:hypothetical protein
MKCAKNVGGECLVNDSGQMALPKETVPLGGAFFQVTSNTRVRKGICVCIS